MPTRRIDTATSRTTKLNCLLEGVLMYLQPQAVQATFEFIGDSSGKGSRVVFDYVRASVLRREGTLYGEGGATKMVARAGEQRQFALEPSAVHSFVEAFGFELGDHKDTHALEETYFRAADGRLVGRINGTHCIVAAAKVAPGHAHTSAAFAARPVSRWVIKKTRP